MSSGDIWFLLIFIILPTAVLVSGFWALLFVRRDPRKTIPQRRQRQARAKSTRDNIEETVQVATIPPPVRAQNEPLAADAVAEVEREVGPPAPLPGPTASELAAGADDGPDAHDDQPDEIAPEPEGDELGPTPAELAAEEQAAEPTQPVAQSVDDEHLVELVDVDDREELIAEIQRRQVAQPARLESSTDEIPDLGEALSEPARLSEAAQHDEWRPRDATEPADAEPAGDWDVSEGALDGEVELDDPSDADADDEPANQQANPDAASGDSSRRYRRRRPRVKLLPSDNGERQDRRGRLAGRRKPGPERPSRRDKGGM